MGTVKASQGLESMIWNQTWGAPGTDAAFGVWSDGSVVYTCGYKSDQLAVVKWNVATGAEIWNGTWGGANFEGGHEVWSDGSYVYVCGYTRSYGAGGNDVAIVKWHVNGTFQGYNTWGYSATEDFATGIWGNASGLFTSGYRYNQADVSNTTLFLIRWDFDLNPVWNRSWGGPLTDIGEDVFGDASGIYVSGYTTSYRSSMDVVLIKWSASGTLLWNNTFGSDAIDEDSYSTWCDGTHVYTAGSVYNFSAPTKRDLLLVRWDQSGNSIANGRFGGTGDDYGWGVWGDGTYLYMGGYTNGFHAGVNDIFLLTKWSGSCTPLWYRTWGGNDGDQGYNVWANADAAFMCGRRNSPPAEFAGDLALVKWDAHGERPDADFISNTTTAIVGSTVTFNYTGTTGDGLVSYQWNFGDGTGNATIQNATHQFNTPGLFSVNLTVRDIDGDESRVSKNNTYTIQNPLPVITQPADVSYTAGTTGRNITWTITDASTSATSYTILRNGSPIGSSSWMNGTPIVIEVGGLGAGTYNYTILVDDGYGGTSQDTVLIIVNAADTPPSIPGFLIAPVVVAMLAGIVIAALRRKNKASPSTSL